MVGRNVSSNWRQRARTDLRGASPEELRISSARPDLRVTEYCSGRFQLRTELTALAVTVAHPDGRDRKRPSQQERDKRAEE